MGTEHRARGGGGGQPRAVGTDRRHRRLAEAGALDTREDDPLAVGRPTRLDGPRAVGAEARYLRLPGAVRADREQVLDAMPEFAVDQLNLFLVLLGALVCNFQLLHQVDVNTAKADEERQREPAYRQGI